MYMREVFHKVNFILKNSPNLELLFFPNRITENLKLKCKRCGAHFERRPQLFLKNQKCPICESKPKTKTNEVFLKDLKTKYGEAYTPLEDYKSENSKIKVRHLCGFIYSTTPYKLLLGKECPKCSKKLIHK